MRIEKERELGFGGGRSDQVQDRNGMAAATAANPPR